MFLDVGWYNSPKRNDTNTNKNSQPNISAEFHNDVVLAILLRHGHGYGPSQDRIPIRNETIATTTVVFVIRIPAQPRSAYLVRVIYDDRLGSRLAIPTVPQKKHDAKKVHAGSR